MNVSPPVFRARKDIPCFINMSEGVRYRHIAMLYLKLMGTRLPGHALKILQVHRLDISNVFLAGLVCWKRGHPGGRDKPLALVDELLMSEMLCAHRFWLGSATAEKWQPSLIRKKTCFKS
jgi:hypothetical protein